MSECCGQQRATWLCPDCGKLLHVDARTELLYHINQTLKRAVFTLKKRKRHNPDIARHSEEAAVARWSKWAELVTRWIARDQQEQEADE